MEKTREIQQHLRWEFKLRVLEFAKEYGKVKETCEMFNVSRNTYFNRKRKYEKDSVVPPGRHQKYQYLVSMH